VVSPDAMLSQPVGGLLLPLASPPAAAVTDGPVALLLAACAWLVPPIVPGVLHLELGLYGTRAGGEPGLRAWWGGLVALLPGAVPVSLARGDLPAVPGGLLLMVLGCTGAYPCCKPSANPLSYLLKQPVDPPPLEEEKAGGVEALSLSWLALRAAAAARRSAQLLVTSGTPLW
jgi:hypothetical protein